jgi:hypothetical protein
MVQTEYCVILCRRPFEFYQPYPRTRRFYVGAPTADEAILAASDTLPQYRPIGVELSDLPSLEVDSQNLDRRMDHGTHTRFPRYDP